MSATYRDLRVWQNAMELTIRVHKASSTFPRIEQFGLTSQIRRAAVSIPSNIAEGKGRHSDREFSQFLLHARGSLLEVETQLMLASELGYLSKKDAQALLSECAKVGKALAGLLNSMRPRPVRDIGGFASDRRPTTDD